LFSVSQIDESIVVDVEEVDIVKVEEVDILEQSHGSAAQKPNCCPRSLRDTSFRDPALLPILCTPSRKVDQI
jgi:hypothetical protein